MYMCPAADTCCTAQIVSWGTQQIKYPRPSDAPAQSHTEEVLPLHSLTMTVQVTSGPAWDTLTGDSSFEDSH